MPHKKMITRVVDQPTAQRLAHSAMSRAVQCVVEDRPDGRFAASLPDSTAAHAILAAHVRPDAH